MATTNGASTRELSWMTYVLWAIAGALIGEVLVTSGMIRVDALHPMVEWYASHVSPIRRVLGFAVFWPAFSLALLHIFDPEKARALTPALIMFIAASGANLAYALFAFP